MKGKKRKVEKIPKCRFCESLIDDEGNLCYICSSDEHDLYCRSCLNACEICGNYGCEGCGSVNSCDMCHTRLCRYCMSIEGEMGGSCSNCHNLYYCDDCLGSKGLCENCRSYDDN